MLNESYVNKLVRLVNSGLITIDDIKNTDYKTEIQNRINSQA